MFAYLVVFILCIVCVKLADNSKEKGISRIFLLLSILLPTLLAGFRSPVVGTDTENYLAIYNWASSYPNFSSFIDDYERAEVGFLSLNFVLSYIGANTTQFLIVLHSLIHLGIFIALFRLRKQIDITWAVFIYLFLMYNESLNMTRQYIAIAFSLLAFSFYITKDYVKAALFICVSILFHVSAIVCLIFPLIHFLTTKLSLKKNPFLLMSCIVIIFVMIVIVVSYYFSLSDNIFVDKFSEYINDDVQSSRVSYSVLFVNLFIFLYIVRNSVINSSIVDTFILISLLSIAFCLLGYISHHLYRFYLYPAIISIQSVAYMLKNTNENSIITKFSIIIIVVFFWYYSFVVQGSHETIPYVSSL